MTTDVQAVVNNEMPLPFGVRAGSGGSLPGLNPSALQVDWCRSEVDPRESGPDRRSSPQWNRSRIQTI